MCIVILLLFENITKPTSQLVYYFRFSVRIHHSPFCCYICFFSTLIIVNLKSANCSDLSEAFSFVLFLGRVGNLTPDNFLRIY